MKFKSKHGLGEICVYGSSKSQRHIREYFVKIISINFIIGDEINYTVEHFTNQGSIQRFTASEAELEGDTDFSQDTGYEQE